MGSDEKTLEASTLKKETEPTCGPVSKGEKAATITCAVDCSRAVPDELRAGPHGLLWTPLEPL